MDDKDIVKVFEEKLDALNLNPAVAALETQLHFLKESNDGTLAGCIANLTHVSEVLVNSDSFARTSISSASSLFRQFITLQLGEYDTFAHVKRQMIDKAEVYLKNVHACHKKLVDHSFKYFTKQNLVILIHSKSIAVESVLVNAAKVNKSLKVFCTQSNPDNNGIAMAESLRKHGISVTVILDAAAAYVMSKVDLVLLGAEGVCVNGGIINKIGSYQMALCAKALNKPVYVVAESFKFTRLYPLGQNDVPDVFKYLSSRYNDSNVDMDHEHPSVDYTPPELIKLHITDLGALTITAVTEELLNLYK